MNPAHEAAQPQAGPRSAAAPAQAPNEQNPAGQLVVVGQLSVDTTVMIEGSLAIHDQSVGQFSSQLGGSAAIVAYNAASAGARVLFTGHVGATKIDLMALDDLRNVGVEVGPTVSTPVGLRVICIVEPDGERTMVSSGSPQIWDRLSVVFPKGQLAFFEGWPLFDRSVAYCGLISKAAAAGSKVVVDVSSAARAACGDKHSELLRSLPIDILLANEAEAERYGLFRKPIAAVQIIHRGSLPTVLIDHGRVSEYAFPVVQPVDTTGAGDAFAAGLLAALAAGFDLPAAIGFAHEVAGRVVLVSGPLLPLHESLASHLKGEVRNVRI